jgi:hypothetical protein
MANELRRAETASPRNLRSTVFEIPDAEPAHTDAYEVAAYLWVKAPLALGLESWVYVDARGKPQGELLSG